MPLSFATYGISVVVIIVCVMLKLISDVSGKPPAGKIRQVFKFVIHR
jgi:hypothetical protein